MHTVSITPPGIIVPSIPPRLAVPSCLVLRNYLWQTCWFEKNRLSLRYHNCIFTLSFTPSDKTFTLFFIEFTFKCAITQLMTFLRANNLRQSLIFSRRSLRITCKKFRANLPSNFLYMSSSYHFMFKRWCCHQ